MEMDTISETQDLLDKLTSLSSSGKLSETSILQKLSPSQISLLTSHLESQTSFKPDKPKKIPSAIVDTALPLQQLEDLQKNEGIITLGGLSEMLTFLLSEFILRFYFSRPNIPRSEQRAVVDGAGRHPE